VAGTWAELALVMFVGMGPVKVLVYYLGATRHASPALGRRVALRAVVAATIVALGLVLAGSILMRLLHFSTGALIVAGGIVLLAYGIQTVLDTAPLNEADAPPTENLLNRLAIYPMGIPLILNPAGIAAAIIFSAEAATVGDLGVIVGVVLAIAVLDVVVLWAARPIGARIPPEGIIVLEQVLGVLLAAVAVELIAIGLGQLEIIEFVPH
jgi:small neutral amino acid transporter SnatA (MarC family)